MSLIKRRAKIAFLTAGNPNDKRSWSGIQYYIAKSLKKYCGDVYFLGPVEKTFSFTFWRLISAITRILFKKRYNYYHTFWLSKSYAKIFEKKIKNKNYDLIFSVPSSAYFASIKTTIPIIHCSDATAQCMLDYYPVYSNLLAVSKRETLAVEKQALNKANLLLYPSQWAATSAVNDFCCDPKKVFVIPFGANVDRMPDEMSYIYDSATCKLLFVGVEWNRKGGEIVYETLLELEKMGVNAQLTVCGCIPPKHIQHLKLRVIPFLDKNDSSQYKEIVSLFSQSDFFLLPTRADFFGIVFCEASAFGLPSLSTQTGGVAGAVTNECNGFLFPKEARGEVYAKKIAEVFYDKEMYLDLREKSKKLYEEKLNWDAWGKEVSRVINENLIKNN